jgi:hypothetical protein
MFNLASMRYCVARGPMGSEELVMELGDVPGRLANNEAVAVEAMTPALSHVRD